MARGLGVCVFSWRDCRPKRLLAFPWGGGIFLTLKPMHLLVGAELLLRTGFWRHNSMQPLGICLVEGPSPGAWAGPVWDLLSWGRDHKVAWEKNGFQSIYFVIRRGEREWLRVWLRWRSLERSLIAHANSPGVHEHCWGVGRVPVDSWPWLGELLPQLCLLQRTGRALFHGLCSVTETWPQCQVHTIGSACPSALTGEEEEGGVEGEEEEGRED